MKKQGKCALATDYRELELKEALWLEERERTNNLYSAFSEYIKFLEKKLEYETDFSEKYLIEQQIKKIKKEMQQYYTPSVLALTKYNLEEKEVNKQKKSSFSLLKKRKYMYN